MTTRLRAKHVNPLLGVYFGVLSSIVVALLVMLLIFEQLGVAQSTLRLLLTIGSLGLFAAVGAAGYTTTASEFFLSGRRVPSFLVGLSLAVSSIGGTGLVTFGGIIFLIGFDGLCLPLGVVAGFVVMVVLIAPYLRKFGALSIPGYLGLRFDSVAVRLTAATIAAAPLILLLVAELKIALVAASWLIDLPEHWAMSLIVLTLIATLTPGGVRSLSWSSAVQSIVVLFAILLPASILAIMVTNLPLGQLSHGPVLRAIGRTELVQGLPATLTSPLAFELPGQGLQAIAGRFATPFSSVGPLAFVIAALGVMAGIAGSPAHLSRTGTTPNVYETRKAIGWSVFLIGLLIMTLSGLAVFLRDVLMNQLAGTSADKLPPAMKTLVELGLAAFDAGAATLSATSFQFRRDGVLLGLPIFMGLPTAVILFAAAGVLAAALAGAAASLCQLGIIVSEDVASGPEGAARAPTMRLATTRLALALIAGAAGWCSLVARGDPLDLLLWSLAISGSALFPVLVLSIWWKRVNAWGALAGLAAGFIATLLGLLADGAGFAAFPGVLSTALGVPASILAAIGVSLATPVPKRHVLELVRDLRIPGGETIFDRELRLRVQRKAQRG